MTEDEARQWIVDRFGTAREAKLAAFVALLIAESQHQNLVSKSSIGEIWARHIVDSAQLLSFADASDGSWIDIGTGAGLPGIVIAILRDAPIMMVEPRRKRVDFLDSCLEELQLVQATTSLAKVEAIEPRAAAAFISARAVAALPALFANAHHLSDKDTVWLLPKGQSAQSEVDEARKAWQGSFHVEQSITHPDSKIVVAQGVRRR